VSAEVEALRPYVVDLLSRRPDTKGRSVFALHHDEPAAGRLVLDGQEVELRWCPSELAIREALSGEPETASLVLLTPITQLASDVLGRLALHRLAHPRAADALMHLFGVVTVDPAISSWMMSALVTAAPAEGYERTGARTLDADRAWRALVRHAHGIRVERGPEGLLDWAASQHAAALAALEDPRRVETLSWLDGELPGARLIVAAVRAGLGARALALGLVMRLVLDGDDEATRIAARTRLEGLLGVASLEERGARAWMAAAESHLERFASTDDPHAQAALGEGEQLLDTLGAAPLAAASPVLRSGLRARLRRLGVALDGGHDLEQAVAFISGHRLAEQSGATAVARLASRLARWLRTDEAAEATELIPAARQYVDSACYADLARTVLRHGSGEPDLDVALSRLVAEADTRRGQQERAFARALGAWSAHAATGGELLGVEDLLAEVVAPLGRARRVLVIVLDGMSHRVAAELLEDATLDGWTELRRAGYPGRTVALAAMPSITTYSRSSLFAGRLVKGLAAGEVEDFAAHASLVAASGQSGPPLLFHKRELRDGGAGLAPDVRGEIAGERRIVGAVVNAIDDHLARSEQLRNPWSVRDIVALGRLLDAARESDRIAVLLSDHGHVIEREAGPQRPHGGLGGERWRAATSPALDDEILVAGPRVLAGEDRCVLAVDEGLRYAPKKHGYHGGATAQEMLAPVLILSPAPVDDLDGWVEAPYDPPVWWSGVRPETDLPLEPPKARRTGPASSRPQPDNQLELGIPIDNPQLERSNMPGWIEALLSSETLAAQRRLAPRTALTDERIASLLAALASRGGKLLRPALAQACGLPPARLPGTLAALGLLLNVEGYPILSVDEASETVELNVRLLREQFGLAP
jgi:hypothetical protein